MGILGAGQKGLGSGSHPHSALPADIPQTVSQCLAPGCLCVLGEEAGCAVLGFSLTGRLCSMPQMGTHCNKGSQKAEISTLKPKVNHKAYFCLQHFWPTTRKTQINFKHIYSLRSSGWEMYKPFCQTGAFSESLHLTGVFLNGPRSGCYWA